MPVATCKLCLNEKELKKSHIIPNSIFKKIFKNNNGSAINVIDDNHSTICRSSDSWWEYLFCENCEKHLNLEYEKYSLSIMRNVNPKIEIVKNNDSIIFKGLDTQRFLLFWVSILWRASLSTLPAYEKVVLHKTWSEEIRRHLCHQIIKSQMGTELFISSTQKSRYL
jgi:hypothetical protein